MSFEFQKDEKVSRGLRRIAHSQIDLILTDLTGRRRISQDKAIHESRKRMKRLRALLRLSRDAMPRSARRREDAAFRDAARTVSAARDAKVLVDAFDELIEHFHRRVVAKNLQPLRAGLVARRQAALKEQRARGTADVVRALRAARKRLSHSTFRGDDFPALRAGLKRTFQRGRRAFGVALHDRDSDRLHEWRKRVKDLLHQLELLEPIWPDVLRQLGEKAHTLADALGEDHDLAVLHQTLTGDLESFGDSDALETLLSLIDARRRELQQAAMQLGVRVYGEKPSAFIERMENYWNAWRGGETVMGPK